MLAWVFGFWLWRLTLVTPSNYWRNCAEGVWWPWYIGSDIWFQDEIWEASSLGSKQLLTKTLIVSWISPGENSMIDCFLGDAFGVTLCPARFGVLFCSVLLCGVEYCSVSWCIFLIHNNIYISRNTFSCQSVNSDINTRLLRHLVLIWLIMEKFGWLWTGKNRCRLIQNAFF